MLERRGQTVQASFLNGVDTKSASFISELLDLSCTYEESDSSFDSEELESTEIDSLRFKPVLHVARHVQREECNGHGASVDHLTSQKQEAPNGCLAMLLVKVRPHMIGLHGFPSWGMLLLCHRGSGLQMTLSFNVANPNGVAP